MGKISKLMKLLSASAVVAGANSVALADCGLCGEGSHDRGNCPHFDYKGYGRELNYYGNILRPEGTPLTESDKDYIGRIADNAKDKEKVLRNFLKTPTSSTISFATPTGDTASSDNTWSNTETATQSSDKTAGTSDKLNALKFERSQDLEDSATTVSESDTAETATALEEMEREEAAVKIQSARRGQLAREAARQRAVNAEIARLEEKAARRRDTQELQDMMRNRVAEDRGKSDRVSSQSDVRDLDLRHRGSEEAKGVAYDNRAEINISDREKIRILAENISQADERREARAARKAKARDREQLNSMMKASLEANREKERNERLSEARALSEGREALENAREARNRETAAAANKIQNAARGRLARKKAADLRKRQAQIDGDYELAKKLQAEYDAEDRQIRDDRKLAKKLQAEYDAEDRQIRDDRKLAKKLQAEYNAEDAQIRADRLLAEQEQLRENLAAEPVAEAQNGADFEYRSEQDQINADNLLAQQEQAREYLGMNAQEPSNATATREVVVADEENETDRWTLPQATALNFRGFDFERMSSRRQADTWARQLDNLSIRKLECMLWLVSTSYQQLQNAGRYAPSAQMAEAISDVNNIFPYSGTNAGIMNVYKAFENTDTAGFVQDLERLGKSGLDGVLYYIANRCMHLLLSGKKAASAKLIELEKAVVEYFNGVWEAKNAQVFGEENETPGVDNTEPAVVNENRREPQVSATAEVRGIVETERAEDTEWNIPYVLHEVLKWPVGSYKGGNNRRVYLGKFNEALQDLGIRRLEVVMYLAASSYQAGKARGGALGNQVLKLAKDIYNNILPAASENKANARLVNWYHALENMHDERLYFGELDHYGRYSFENNDMNTYDASFQGAFRRITAGEQEVVLGKIATLYREKLREGKKPSTMLLVDFADQVCKELSLDGFFGGEDTEEDHPAWDKDNERPMWEFRKEFESDVQPAVVNPQNADRNVDYGEEEDEATNDLRRNILEDDNRAMGVVAA